MTTPSLGFRSMYGMVSWLYAYVIDVGNKRVKAVCLKKDTN